MTYLTFGTHIQKKNLALLFPLLTCKGKIVSKAEGCGNVQCLNGASETSELKELKGRETMRSCSLT